MRVCKSFNLHCRVGPTLVKYLESLAFGYPTRKNTSLPAIIVRGINTILDRRARVAPNTVSKNVIEAFLNEMRNRHKGDIEAVNLPDGTREYVEECIGEADVDTIIFMLKLGYLMGLQTGFAAAQAGETEVPPASSSRGPIQA